MLPACTCGFTGSTVSFWICWSFISTVSKPAAVKQACPALHHHTMLQYSTVEWKPHSTILLTASLKTFCTDACMLLQVLCIRAIKTATDTILTHALLLCCTFCLHLLVFDLHKLCLHILVFHLHLVRATCSV